MLCNGFTKLSLLTFYLHLSPQKWFRVAVWIGIAIVSLYTGCITTLMLFHCNPIRKAFDFGIVGGSCLDVGVLYMATAVSNIITDVMLFILPMPMIFNLRMKLAQKIGAALIFAIGSMLVNSHWGMVAATSQIANPFWQNRRYISCSPNLSPSIADERRSIVGCCSGEYLDVSCPIPPLL